MIQQSDHTGSQLFGQISGGGGANATALQSTLGTLEAVRHSDPSRLEGRRRYMDSRGRRYMDSRP